MDSSAAGHSLNSTPGDGVDGGADATTLHRHSRQRSVESRHGGTSGLLGGDVLQVDMGQLANVLGERVIVCLSSIVMLCGDVSFAASLRYATVLA